MKLTAQCNADEQCESPGRTQNRKQMFLNCSMYKNIFTVLSISPFLTRRQAENNRSFMSFAGKCFLSDTYKLTSKKNGINFRQITMINVFFPFTSSCTKKVAKKKTKHTKTTSTLEIFGLLEERSCVRQVCLCPEGCLCRVSEERGKKGEKISQQSLVALFKAVALLFPTYAAVQEACSKTLVKDSICDQVKLLLHLCLIREQKSRRTLHSFSFLLLFF